MKASSWRIAKLGEWVAFKTGKRESGVARPARAMLTRFGEATIPMAEQAHTLHRQIHNRRRTRDLLLPRLLSGQISYSTKEKKHATNS